MKAGAQFEQRSHATTSANLARGGLQNAGHALQQSRLARSVVTDQPDGLAFFDRDVDVVERPEVFIRNAPEVDDALFE